MQIAARKIFKLGGGSYIYRGFVIEKIDRRWVFRYAKNHYATKTLKDAKFLLDRKVGA